MLAACPVERIPLARRPDSTGAFDPECCDASSRYIADDSASGVVRRPGAAFGWGCGTSGLEPTSFTSSDGWATHVGMACWADQTLHRSPFDVSTPALNTGGGDVQGARALHGSGIVGDGVVAPAPFGAATMDERDGRSFDVAGEWGGGFWCVWENGVGLVALCGVRVGVAARGCFHDPPWRGIVVVRSCAQSWTPADAEHRHCIVGLQGCLRWLCRPARGPVH